MYSLFGDKKRVLLLFGRAFSMQAPIVGHFKMRKKGKVMWRWSTKKACDIADATKEEARSKNKCTILSRSPEVPTGTREEPHVWLWRR